jgi:putative ABC transport system substrate-binding protein
MRRRTLLIGLVLAVPIRVAAQDAAKIPRIGFLGNSTPELEANLVGPFREGLRELGYVEGQSILIEYRWAGGDYGRLPELVAELVAAKVLLIATAGTPASLAVTKSAPGLPLVMIAVGDPIGTGLAQSLARPGGNATGLTSISLELEGKRLEIIKEALPSAGRLGVLTNPTNPYLVKDEEHVRAAASTLKVATEFASVQRAEDVDGALMRLLDGHVDVILIPADRIFLHERQRIVDFSSANRIPLISAYRELAEAGGLISFGPSYAVMHRQAARYVDKILKGAKPADLPIEQPGRFELVVNAKTAKSLGVQIPATLLTRADEVIE